MCDQVRPLTELELAEQAAADLALNRAKADPERWQKEADAAQAEEMRVPEFLRNAI